MFDGFTVHVQLPNNLDQSYTDNPVSTHISLYINQ